MSIFGFGRKRRGPDAAERLRKGRWKCGKCDEWHSWPFDLAANAPDPWPHERSYEPNSDLRMEGDFLSEDFCVMGGQYFMIRCVLAIPVIGVPGVFGFGCWSSLSRENFEKYIAGFDTGDYADRGPWTGWLLNRLADFMGEDPSPIEVWVEPRPDRQRPRLHVAREGHPLAIAQEDGITPERMLEVFAFYGHAPS